MDEKGFHLGVINRTKRVFDVNAKRQGKLLGASQDGNRSWITFLACICQDMTSLPPFLIYQGKPGQVQDTWLTDFDPEHQSAFFSTSETGWTSHELGKEWLIGVFDRFTKAKARNGRDYRLLITDGHSSHINMDFLDWCDAHRIIVAVFPPHSTHRLQPLDVSLFGPLSTADTNRLVQWTSKTQGLTGLSKREFWVLFWGALEAAFTPENIASGWRRTGLKPFDPDVVLSQQSSVSSDTGARKLKRTLESLQAEVELLRHENQGLRETIIREKQRRQRGKALKDYIFDRVDPNSAQVFSPQKIAQARQKKIEMEAQKEEEVLQKRTEKALRQKRVEEQKQLVLERKRQREEKKERKRREKETKQLEREANRQLRIEMKKQNQRSIQPKHQARQNGSDGLEENGGIQDEIIVVLPTVTQTPVLFKPPNEALSTPNTKASTPPSHKTRPKRPSLVVESDREVVVAYRDSGRSQRNRKRPRWLDDFEVN
uniref:DDE-1 domain-containing protein n=1 Tax=Fusarium oxysporum (strain Fo5176) TaxID=660025 RepID=A0A0D2YJN5_FUSOF